MEWRAFLAITLSMLVLIVFQIFFAGHQTTRQGPKLPANATESGVASPDFNKKKGKSHELTLPSQAWNTGKADDGGEAGIPGDGTFGPPREIVYETPLFKAVFTEEGGAIKAFYLKKYRQTVQKDSPWINIVNAIPPLLPFATGLKAQGRPGFTPIFMKAENKDGTIRFRGVLTNGAVVTKEYRLHDDSYWIDLAIEVEGASNVSPPALVLANRPVLEATQYIFQGISLLGKNAYEEIGLEDNKPSTYSGQLTWISIGDKYFMTTLIPMEERQASWDVEMWKIDDKGFVASFVSPLTYTSTATHTLKFGLYLGPKDIDILKAMGHDLAQTINFGWFDILAKPLLYFLKFFYKFTHNYGIAIILLTVLIKIVFWPLAHKSAKAMKTMQKIQPRLQKLKEKYGDDKERLNKELLQLYKTYKVNPMSGCLPMLLQIPVFFALYKVLLQAIELRHAPFLLWINDLSAPDRLMIPGIDIPWIHGLPVLTILMGVSMWWQQKLTPASLDPTQAKIMQFLPVVFTFMFLTFPSGLVLYWLVNNILSIAQQYYINKFTD